RRSRNRFPARRGPSARTRSADPRRGCARGRRRPRREPPRGARAQPGSAHSVPCRRRDPACVRRAAGRRARSETGPEPTARVAAGASRPSARDRRATWSHRSPRERGVVCSPAMAAVTDPRPLSGVVVIDLTRVLAGPYCTLVLSNLGARVIKVERPGSGDDARGIGPFAGGKSLYFGALNHGKESIALDLRDSGDRAVFERLCGVADVLVENYRPGVLDRLGYGWEALHRRWPLLIYAAASGFGHTGPLRERPAFDMVVQAMGGIMSLTGHPDGPPARVGVSIGDIAAGLFLAVGIAAALHHRRDTGAGTMIDVAMLDCQLAILENALTTHLVTGELPGRLGSRDPKTRPFQAFDAADGQPVVLCAGHDAQFAALCDVLARPDLAADERFRTMDTRRRHGDALEREVAAGLRRRPG